MLKIKQSYHGTGSKDGYKWRVYNTSGRKLGELLYVSPYLNVGHVVKINGELYEIVSAYDSDNPRHEKSEVIFYELIPYTFEPNYDLGEIIK